MSTNSASTSDNQFERGYGDKQSSDLALCNVTCPVCGLQVTQIHDETGQFTIPCKHGPGEGVLCPGSERKFKRGSKEAAFAPTVKQQLRIGVVGNGVVGNATARCWMEHAEVRVWDQMPERCTHKSLANVLQCDIVFVCLPETALDEFFDKFGTVCPSDAPNLVLKSTCPIGTTRRLRERHGLLKNLVHSPEFLTARCAVADAQLPAQLIIGFPAFGVSHHSDQFSAGMRLTEAYVKRFPGINIRHMSSDESEAVKLFLNSAFAVKIALFNELNLLAEKLGLDWNRVLKGMLGDGRIAQSHTQVPGIQSGEFGFSGACLPKDLKQLMIIESSVKCDNFSILSTAFMRNKEIDRKRGVK